MTTLEGWSAPVDDLPELDIFSAEFMTDPHAVLAGLRSRHWAARSIRGVELLTYDVCERVMLDARFLHGAPKLLEFLGPDAMEMMVGPGRTLLASEGADHFALRRAIGPWFTPRRVADLQAATRELLDRLLASSDPSGRCDFMTDVAEQVPGVVFCWMVGAPDEDGAQLAAWSSTLLKAFNANPDDGPAIRGANDELRAYVDELMAIKRATPADDVTSILLAAVADGAITDDDVRSLLLEMLSASSDNTIHTSGLMVWLLATHPEEWDKLVTERSLTAGAIEECMRYEPRVGSTVVHNPEDVTLDGLPIPGGSLTWLSFASAHRDPAVFDDADRFDVARVLPKHQLSFGVGRHYCLGAALARMELQAVLDALLDRGARPVIEGDVGLDRTFGASLTSLPISFSS